MRVVHLDTGRELRGGQRQVLLLHRGLLERGVDSLLLAPGSSPLAATCHAEGLPVVPLEGRRPWHPGVLARVRRTVRGAGVVHLHDPHAATLAALAVGAGRPPLVVCHRRAGFPLRRGRRHRLKYRRVDRWIAVTDAIRADLEAWGVAAARIHTIHSAIDLAAVAAAAAADGGALRSRLGLPAAAPLVAAVGALDHQKGFTVLVRALAAVAERWPELHAVVVGEGPERAVLEGLAASLGLATRLHLLGHRDDVPAVLAAATACVVPSLAAEGSSAVVKEAMAIGRPLLAARLPGLVEVAGEAACWLPPGDHDALATALLALREQPQAARRRVELGRARVARFDVGALVSAVLEVYHDRPAAARP